MSQGLIRLKKVKAAPKRNLSIMKKTVYKKQLSVRFEDQKPFETIKHLSQDIDMLSQMIDSYFPLKPIESLSLPAPNPNPQSKPEPLSLAEYSNPVKPLEANHSSQHKNVFRVSGRSTPQVNESSFDTSHGTKKDQTVCKTPNEIDLRAKYKNMAVHEEYGFDLKVIKNGGHLIETQNNFKDLIQNIDLVTPKIVKQTKPSKRVTKIKRRSYKDVVVAS